jgi:hydroxymethylbilane synthase
MALRSDLEVVELRGNVPTRVRKVDQGIVHAAILAAAGLLRLGVHQRITQFLAPPDWLPAPGQGAIAVQSRSDDRATNDLLAKLNHSETARSVAAERAFLAALDGGCQVPIGALVLSDGDSLMLHGFISDVRGTQPLRGNVAIDIHAPEESGRALAEDLRARGANSLLLELRAASEIPAPQPE